MEIKSKTTPFELENGKVVELTLNFKKLLEMRSKRPNDYKKCNDAFCTGFANIAQAPDIIYAAYLCGAENMDTAMGKEEFIDLMPPDIMYCANLATSLMKPKKNPDSDERSKTQPDDHTEEK